MPNKYAAVDLGAESGRVIVGSLDGERLELDAVHRFSNVPVRAMDTLYWDVLRLWDDIQEGLSHAARKHGADLAGIGVDTWGVDFGLLDCDDRLLGNPVHYRDSRHDGMIEKAFETVRRAELFEATGLQFLPFNTLYQLLALKQQASPQLAMAKTLLFMPDLLNFWLSGTKANEYTIASTTQMIEPSSRTWNKSLLARFDLPQEIFPELVAPASKLGSLQAIVAERTGLSRKTAIYAPGSHDTASAVVAVPAQGTSWAYLSSGTWSLMGLELSQPLVNDRVAQLNFTNEGGVGGTIRFLKNIAGLWLVQECRRTWMRGGNEYSYDELTALARQAPALGAIVDPDHPSFAAPGDMPSAISNYCNHSAQTAPAGVGEMVRCCLESLALRYRWVFERLEELRGAPIEVLHIVGGGSQNALLNQFVADCLNRPVVCGPVEATAVGNILTQAMGHGELRNLDEVRAVVRSSFTPDTYYPDRGQAGAWEDAYGRFLKLIAGA